MTSTIIVGDCREVLRAMPAGSVHSVITSPPYFGLRDYGTGEWVGGDPGCDHVAKRIRTGLGMAELSKRYKGGGHKAAKVEEIQYAERCEKCGAERKDSQIGLEATPADHLEVIVSVFREVRRVLRDDGTLWLNYGDSYASKQPRGSFGDQGDLSTGAHGEKVPPRDWSVWNLSAKNLVGMPWRVALALQADGWILRSDIIWSKPNPMPESVRDRPTKAHEYLFLFAKRPRYFYDAEAIREEPAGYDRKGGTAPYTANGHVTHGIGSKSLHQMAKAGRNKRTVWHIPTAPYSGAHFAVFPPNLILPAIQASTSAKGVCSECGAPWERVVEGRRYEPKTVPAGVRHVDASRGDKTRKLDGKSAEWQAAAASRKTTGWRPSCDHDAERVPATILDPFGGAGTVGLVCERHGRDSVLIELNADYARQAEERIRDDIPGFLADAAVEVVYG